MAYFKLTFQNPPGQNVKARVTFPDDCYVADGGEKAIPVGERVPAGNYGYTVFYDRPNPQNCNIGDVNRVWVLPYTPDQNGSGLTVFLVDRVSGDVKDTEGNPSNVDED